MSANFMTKKHAAGRALAAKRGQIKVSELEGAAKSMHDNMTEGELEEFARTSLRGLPRTRTEETVYN